MDNYSLDRMKQDLNNGFGLYFDYNNNSEKYHTLSNVLKDKFFLRQNMIFDIQLH